MRIILTVLCLLSYHIQADTLTEYNTETLSVGLQQPWAMALLSESELLITEKPGNLRLFSEGKLSKPISGVPPVFYAGQGGLLDVEVLEFLAPRKYKILLSLAIGNADKNALSLVSATLTLGQVPAVSNVQEIIRVSPYKSTPVHYGGRIVLLPDNTVLLTSGDGFDYRESAQKPASLLGKIIRVNIDGSIPKDNPFVANSDYHPAIYSLGHRNPQALLFDSFRNWIVSHEHGPAGGDEINIIEAGNNYGWPVITYGKDYSGANISPFTEYEGMQQPFIDWTPSIAPSDMIVYQGNMFSEFKGDYLVTTLKTQELRWVDMDGKQVKSQHSLLLNEKTRYRAISESSSGVIYLLTDDGRLLSLARK